MLAEELVKYPNYDYIIRRCKEEMVIKFKQYGNTWETQDAIYYKERLKKEVEEYVESMTVESEKRKLINIVNIATLAHDTAETNRGCPKHVVSFDMILNSRDRTMECLCRRCKAPLVVKTGIIYGPGEKVE